MADIKFMTRIIATGCFATLTLTACGSGFSPLGISSSDSSSTSPAPAPGAANGSTGSGGNGASATPAPTPTATPPANSALQNIDLSGILFGGLFGNLQVLTLDPVAKQLILSLPMPALSSLEGVGLQIPLSQIPGATYGIDSLPNGGTSLALHVPLSALMNGVSTLTPSALPNGDPLPQIPHGELPAMAVQLNSSGIKATIYLAAQTLGIFVNTPFDPLISLQVPIKSADGTQIYGYLTTIPAHRAPQVPAQGGFFISVEIPNNIAQEIDSSL